MSNVPGGALVECGAPDMQRVELLEVLDGLRLALDLATIAAEGPDPEVAYRYLADALMPIRPLLCRAADLNAAPSP